MSSLHTQEFTEVVTYLFGRFDHMTSSPQLQFLISSENVTL